MTSLTLGTAALGAGLLPRDPPKVTDMIRKLILASAAVLCATAVHAQPANGGHADATMDFVTKAAQSDAFERAEGRLAEHRAHNPAVRRFAAEMVAAHTKTTAGLKAAIRRAHMDPPPPPALSGPQA